MKIQYILIPFIVGIALSQSLQCSGGQKMVDNLAKIRTNFCSIATVLDIPEFDDLRAVCSDEASTIIDVEQSFHECVTKMQLVMN